MKHQLNNSEWNIISFLWDEQPLTMTEIVKKMEDEQGWSKSTTKTVLKRMLDKGIINYDRDQKPRKYYTALKKEEVQFEETDSFVNRVFEGKLSLLVNNFVSTGRMSREEIRQLQDILDQAEKKLE